MASDGGTRFTLPSLTYSKPNYELEDDMIEDLMARVRETTAAVDERIAAVVAPLLEERENLIQMRGVVEQARRDVDAGIARLDSFLAAAGHKSAKKPLGSRSKPRSAGELTESDYEVARALAGLTGPSTSLEVGEVLGVTRGTAGARLRAARDKGLIREAGERPSDDGVGKPSRLYAVLPDTMKRVEEAMAGAASH